MEGLPDLLEPRQRNRPLLATFGVILVLIGSASAMFVGSYTGQRVAGLASRVQQLERALGSAELARVYIVQAAYLSAETDAQDTLARTIDAARESIAATESEVDGYQTLTPAEVPNLLAALSGFLERSDQTIRLIETGQTALAARAIPTGLDPSTTS